MGKLKPILTTAIALAAALAAQQAAAVIVSLDSPSSQDRAADALLASSFNQLFAAGASGSRLPCPLSDDDGDQTPRVQPKTHASGWSCDPASISTGNSSANCFALANPSAHLPDASLQTTLAREATLTLSTGPPFELLRPA